VAAEGRKAHSGLSGHDGLSGPDQRQGLKGLLQASWYRPGILTFLLLPVSLLYRLIVRLRYWLYRLGVLKSQKIDCCVLVVGNVIVGGAGKTPTVIAIVQHLQSLGLRVGVISRGYGRKQDGVHEISATSLATEAGDEPLLIARATGAPVFVGRDRVEAARALLDTFPTTAIIVCDDGLQHYRLWRDVEICVFDDRGAGNGSLLPSGPLRETWPRTLLAQAGQSAANSLLLHTGRHPAFEGFTARRQLATSARRADGTEIALSEITKLTNQGPLCAVAGIAQPAQFFEMLRENGLELAACLPLPDHCDYSQIALQEWSGYQLICTEKDAVKLWEYVPDALAVALIQTLEPAFYQQLDQLLQQLPNSPLSSRHGHQTA